MSKIFRLEKDNKVSGTTEFEGTTYFEGPVSIQFWHPQFVNDPETVQLSEKPTGLIPVYNDSQLIGFVPFFAEINYGQHK